MSSNSVALDVFPYQSNPFFDDLPESGTPFMNFLDSSDSSLSELSECSSPERSPEHPSESVADYSLPHTPFEPLTSLNHGFQQEDEAEVKKRRLARKAELARVNRKRKKDRIAELQDQVNQLQAELARERKRSQAELPSLIPNAMPDTSCNSPPPVPNSFVMDTANPEGALCSFVERVVVKVQEERTQLNNLQASMLPCLALRFVQWVLSRSDEFYSDPGSLWFSLFVQEVGASPEQLTHLMNLRKDYVDQPPLVIPAGAEMMTQAFDVLRRSLDDSSRLLASFMQIFTPTQLALFFQWVERYGAVCLKINVL